ncbi:MAG: SDR family NAD(P)-dependent oxidoreductase [Rhizonema sp. NSF051]|nr:SDR family NAD(P)-dependent oxidoreductase [Rhizonema sp. NSF051]
MEVNFFNVLELTHEILAVMCKQRSGHILNLTSISGVVASVGGYEACGSRFQRKLCVSEVKPLGIRVTIVEFAGVANI